MRKVEACVACRGGRFRPMPFLYRFRGQEITLLRCRSCGLITVSPLPAAEELAGIYDGDYFFHPGRGRAFTTPWIDGAEKRNRFAHNCLLPIVEKFVPSGRVLEIGCAGGAALAAFKAAGFEEYGLELNGEIADWGRNRFGVNIQTGAFEDRKFPDEFFDVVYHHDTLEHLLDPVSALLEIRRLLKPEGIVVFRTLLEANTLAFRSFRLLAPLFRWRWKFRKRPDHLYFFEPRTLRSILTRTGYILMRWEPHMRFVRTTRFATEVADRLNVLATRWFGLFAGYIFVVARKGNDRGPAPEAGEGTW